MSTMQIVFRSALSHHAPFVFIVVVALFMRLVFLYFFQKLPTFCVQIHGLGIRFRG